MRINQCCFLKYALTGSGPNSRTSQLFIALRGDGGNFGKELWETPIGVVAEGMENVRAFYSGYGDMPPVRLKSYGQLCLARLTITLTYTA